MDKLCVLESKKSKGVTMKKFLFVLGLTTCLSLSAKADFSDGLLAYQYKQYPTALAEFTYLADEGNPAASYYLGKLYQEGLGTTKSSVKAHFLFQQADAGYYFPATTELGKTFLYGSEQIPAEPLRGIDFLKKATHAGEASAAYELGKIYDTGKIVEENPNYAYGYYLIAALRGDMKAQYALANLYLKGRGVPQDYKEALKWLKRSAHQGYVLAQIELADIQMNNHLLKNAANSYGWSSIIAAYNSDSIGKKAAEWRDALATGLDAKVLTEMQEKVRNWKPTSAEKSVPREERENTQIPTIPDFNDAQAMQNLLISEGFLPRNGSLFGITNQMIDNAVSTQDPSELTNQVEKAVSRGKKEAYGYYADLFKTRFDNLAEAFTWYKKGAEAGDVYAEYQLAKMFCEGKGIAQPDAVACYAWLKVAQAEQNPILNGLIQSSLSVVRSNATPEELEAGEKMFSTLQKTPEEKEQAKNSFLSFF